MLAALLAVFVVLVIAVFFSWKVALGVLAVLLLAAILFNGPRRPL